MANELEDDPVARRRGGRETDPLASEARRILRAEMMRRGFTFKRLAFALQAAGDGDIESVQTLINKANRGRFSFAFLLRACRAMGMTTLDIRPSGADGNGLAERGRD